MEQHIGINEARPRLGDLITEVAEQGTSIVLTRNGKPVARLVPAETPPRPQPRPVAPHPQILLRDARRR